MAFYTYKSLTPKGEIISRSGHFSGLHELMASLESRNESLADLHAYPDFIESLYRIKEGKLKTPQIIEICNFIGMYVSSGLDINSALQDMKNNNKNKLMIKVISDLHRDLLDGYPLSDGMERCGLIPPLVIHMTRIGEETGQLEQLLKDAANHLERIEAIKSSTKRALIYPGFTLAAVTGGFIFWMAYVVPKLVELFVTMNIDLPTPTKILITISDFFSQYWLSVIAAVFITPIIITLGRKNEKFRLKMDKALWNTPILGEMLQLSQKSFYFQYLALMYASGVLISDALVLVRNAITNSHFKDRLESLHEKLKEGYTLAESFSQPGIFDPLVLRMISIGEQTGSLDNQLNKMAETYFEKLQAQVEVMGKTLEPLIMLFVGVLFAFFVIALLGPLYDLIGGVSNI